MVVVNVEDGLVMVEDSAGSGGLESTSGAERSSDDRQPEGLMPLEVTAIDGAEGDSGRGVNCGIFKSSCAFLHFLNLDPSLLRRAPMLSKALSGVERNWIKQQ